MITLHFHPIPQYKYELFHIYFTECLYLGTIGLIVAPWKFDVLKTRIFDLEASLLGQIFVLRASNSRMATIGR